MKSLEHLTAEDEAVRERLGDQQEAMLARTKAWAAINTGSYNVAGLRELAPHILDAFSALDAEVRPEAGDPIPVITDKGTEEFLETAPVLLVTARPTAPIQVVLTGHYDTVFPKGTFTDIKHVGGDMWNGPGLADMKGGLVLMCEALKAFEAGPFKERIGYRVVITPDEEEGNFASARALTEAATSGAMVGMTFEPAMDTGELAAARKGSAVMNVVLHGRATHAGRAKQEGRSALLAAAEMVVGLEALNGQREGVTLNVGKIEGGSAVNIVPDLAVIRFGARAPDAAAAAWAMQEIKVLYERAVARDGIHGHFHGGFYRPPKPRNGAQDALIAAVQGTGRALGLDLRFADTGGVCEGNNIFAAGVPNIDTLGVRGGRIHSAEEFLLAESLPERASLTALLLNRIADGRINAAAIKALM